MKALQQTQIEIYNLNATGSVLSSSGDISGIILNSSNVNESSSGLNQSMNPKKQPLAVNSDLEKNLEGIGSGLLSDSGVQEKEEFAPSEGGDKKSVKSKAVSKKSIKGKSKKNESKE